jgi:hypothetical protein
MTALTQMTDEQFERYALEVMLRELGADGFARFLRLNWTSEGDFTRDRYDWQKDLAVDKIVASLERS